MTGLVGWWPLHENTGSTARDLSGNGNHGTLNGGVTQGVAGKGGLTAYSFDGSDDYVLVSDNPFGDGFARSTVSAWIYLPTGFGPDDADGQIVAKDEGGNNSDDIRFGLFSTSNAGYLQAYIIDSSGDIHAVRSNKTSWGPGWHHVLITMDTIDSSGKVYINGSKDNSTFLPSDINLWGRNYDFSIGAGQAGSTGNFPYPLCDVRIYNRALSPQEIQTLYEWGSGDYTDRKYHDGSDPGALSRWKFDGNVQDAWGSYDGDDNTDLAYASNAIRNQAKKFDGSGDYVLVNSGNDFSQDFSSSGITVSAWVRTSSTGSRKTIWAGNGSDAWWDTRVNENEKLEMWYGSSNSNPNIVSSTSLEKNKWYHAAFSVRPSDYRIRLYLNGVQDGSGGNGNDPNYKQFSTNSIGERENDEWMDGVIDDLRIYTRSLEPYEVFQLYQWGTKGRDMRKLTINQRG